jgi:tetratricopeptide (TPR) repeat protein
MRGLASERPTVLLVDDLHFASEESHSLFMSLALAAPGHRVLLVGTTRPGIDEKWAAELTRLPQTRQVPVGRLGPKDLALLLKDSFRSDELAQSLALQIGLKSDGNPFFAFEIIRGLREGQFITQKDDGTWVGTSVVADIKIPSSVLDLVNARIADLDDEDKDLLEVASCWGYEFDPVLVAEAAGVAAVPALKRFGRIEKTHRLVRASGRSVVFDHHQVQEALYLGILEQLREHYHAALAAALETRTKAADKDPGTLDGALCVDLCEHFLRGYACTAAGDADRTGAVPDASTGGELAGGEFGSATGSGTDSSTVSARLAPTVPLPSPSEPRGESALRYLAPAQTHLQRSYLNAQMITLTERALAVPGLLAGVPRAKALLQLAGPLEMLGRTGRLEACVREAERLADEAADDDLRRRAAMALGTLFVCISRPNEASDAFRRALELARVRGDRYAEALAEQALGTVDAAQIRRSEGRGHFERALAICREIGNRRGEAAAELGLGNVQPTHTEAREYRERALAIFRELGDRRGEASALANLGIVFLSEGRVCEAKERFERALETFRWIGDRKHELSVAAYVGAVLRMQGRLSESRERYERCLALGLEIGDREGEARSLLQLGRLSAERGEREVGEDQLLRSLAITKEVGPRWVQALTCHALGSLRAAAGAGERARETLAEALELAREVGDTETELLVHCELALLPDGDAADALAAFAEHGGRLWPEERRRARLLLWKITGNRTHLVEAKRLLDEAAGAADEETRALMLSSVRVNREIVAACRAEAIA